MSTINKQHVDVVEDHNWEKLKKQIPKQKIYKYGNMIHKIFIGYKNPMSTIELSNEDIEEAGVTTRNEFLNLIIKNALTKIAMEYIGRKTLNSTNITVCCSLIRNYFSHLGFPELIFAFELALARKINVDTNLYSNKFGAEYVGRVLGVYNNYRKEVIKIIRTAELELHTDENQNHELIRKKNKAARSLTIKELSSCYKNFLKNQSFRIPFLSFKLLNRLGYNLAVGDKEENEFLEKIYSKVRRQINKEKEQQVSKTKPDQSIKDFFNEQKVKEVTPKAFYKDLQRKLKIYEEQQDNMVNREKYKK